MDKASAIRDSLRSIGTNEHTISQVVSNAHTDSIGIARSWTRTGELGQAFTPPAGNAHIPRHFFALDLVS